MAGAILIAVLVVLTGVSIIGGRSAMEPRLAHMPLDRRRAIVRKRGVSLLVLLIAEAAAIVGYLLGNELAWRLLNVMFAVAALGAAVALFALVRVHVGR